MRADLHIHSEYSNDGVSTVQQIIDTAVERGLGCVAITDHNSFEAYSVAKDNGRVIVIPGVEVSSKEGHILAYGVDRNIPRDMSVKDTIDAIHEAGGVAFAAHPYRWWSGLGEKNVLNHDFDGVEVKNARCVKGSNRKAERLAEKVKKPISGGSDAHTPEHIGEGYVEFIGEVSDWKDAVTLLMEGKVKIHGVDRKPTDTLKYGVKSILEWIFRGFRKM